MAIWWLCTSFCGLRSLSQHVLLSSVMLCFNRIWRDLMGFTVNIWNNPVILSSGGWYHNHIYIYYSISRVFYINTFINLNIMFIYIILLYTAGISSKNPSKKNQLRKICHGTLWGRARVAGHVDPKAIRNLTRRSPGLSLAKRRFPLKKWPN